MRLLADDFTLHQFVEQEARRGRQAIVALSLVLAQQVQNGPLQLAGGTVRGGQPCRVGRFDHLWSFGHRAALRALDAVAPGRRKWTFLIFLVLPTSSSGCLPFGLARAAASCTAANSRIFTR